MSARSPTSPRAPATVSHIERCSQVDASGALTSPRFGPPYLRRTRDHSTDERDVAGSYQVPGLSQVASAQRYELLLLLLDYISPRDNGKVSESILLHSIEQVWMDRENDFKLVLGSRYDGCHEVLRMWIGVRRETRELRSIIKRQLCV